MTPSNTAAPTWALLLLDYQHDFLDPAGRMPVAPTHVEPMLASSQLALECALKHRAPVVAVSNEFPSSQVIRNLLRRRAALAGTPGASWDPRIAALGAIRLAKSKPSAFSNPRLMDLLDAAGVGEVAVAGLYARACITATVEHAVGLGLHVTVLDDALACRDDRSRAAAVARMAGFGAEVTTAEKFVAAANRHV
ncbi:MAG: cysteine hydrolase family protein [Acidimicrobiales bacterium]